MFSVMCVNLSIGTSLDYGALGQDPRISHPPPLPSYATVLYTRI